MTTVLGMPSICVSNEVFVRDTVARQHLRPSLRLTPSGNMRHFFLFLSTCVYIL